MISRWLLSRQAQQTAWFLWIGLLVVVCVNSARNPTQRMVYPVYHQAALHWMHGESLYQGDAKSGFLYLPQGAIVVVPLAMLGLAAGTVGYQIIGWSLMIGGLWRIARLIQDRGVVPWTAVGAHASARGALFAPLALLAWPGALASIQKGQANTFTAAFILHVAVELELARWWRAAMLLGLAMAVKPIILPVVLLVAVLYRPVSWRLAIALGVVAILPFLTQAPGYAAGQYHEAFAKLTASAQPDANNFADLNGIVLSLTQRRIPRAFLLGLNLAAGAAILGLGWLARQRWPAPLATFWLMTLAAMYLMLFNPRTEANSYIIMAPWAALMTVLLLFAYGRYSTGVFAAAVCVIYSAQGWGDVVMDLTNPWIKPLVTIGLAVVAVWMILTGPVRLEAIKQTAKGAQDAKKFAD